MRKIYRVGAGVRAINAVFRRFALWGRGQDYLHVLTVTGRTSGLERSVPVDVMEVGGVKYLVSPYGEVNWVRNLRAAGKATLRRGSHVQEYDGLEVSPADAIPVIREYVGSVSATKDYWDVTVDASDEEILEDARIHPVFALRVPQSVAGEQPRDVQGSP